VFRAVLYYPHPSPGGMPTKCRSAHGTWTSGRLPMRPSAGWRSAPNAILFCALSEGLLDQPSAFRLVWCLREPIRRLRITVLRHPFLDGLPSDPEQIGNRFGRMAVRYDTCIAKLLVRNRKAYFLAHSRMCRTCSRLPSEASMWGCGLPVSFECCG